MTGIILIAAFFLVAAGGAAVVLTREPSRQIFAMAANGLMLGLLFFALQAPDVALSEIAVGTAALPFLFLVALTAIRLDERQK